MSTLTNILEKRQSGEIKTKTEATYFSERLQEEIKIVKKPLSEFMALLQETQESNNQVMAMNYMIYTFCPMFKDPDGVKATMEYYENQGIIIPSPRELPEYVFDSDMGEMGAILEIISDFYNVDELGEDIKN